jgi:ribosome-associated toxin RatA of RatAB toxin-antitoxin module
MALETIEREHTIHGVHPRAVYDIVTDYACYPRIFPEFTSCRVVEQRGATRRVEFRARVIVEVRYVIDIVHEPAQLSTRWSFVQGEVVSDSEGGWSLVGDDRATRCRYRAGIAVKAPLPKFVINKVSNALLGTSIPNMFRALEREALARAKYAIAPQPG